jgi:hypothetical protein
VPTKLDDPAWRRERARKARAAQDTVDYHIAKLVEDAPPLTSEQKDKLALLLRGGS